MFHLWIGAMAGVLLAYLWMRAQAPRRPGRLRPWRWWLAGFAAFIILIPVGWELVRTAFGSFGLLEAFKTVLLPWAAGVGFGIWLYLTIVPLPRVSGRVAPRRRKGGTPESEAIARELSFVPIAVALLFVTLIVSDEQYGWMSRLQKLSFSGGGLEFAPARSLDKSQQANYHGAESGIKETGEGRVTGLVYFMANMDSFTSRHKDLAEDVGYEVKPEVFMNDVDFAQSIVAPLGQHLVIIHKARGYNNLGLLINRPIVDAFRFLILSHRDSVKMEAQRRELAKEVSEKIKDLWSEVCKTEMRLHVLEAIGMEDRDKVASCDHDEKTADEALDHWLDGKAIIVNHALPYGTLLAAMLLNASGEVDSAVRDLDEWVANNAPDPKNPAEQYKLLGVYRALNQSTLLLMASDWSDSVAYLVVDHSRRLAEIGEKILTSRLRSAPSHLSWRTQMRHLEKGDRIDLMWEMGICSNDLTEGFKAVMFAYLGVLNNLAFILSQNIEFAERQNLVKEMERRSDYLVKKINVRCLLPTDKRQDADSSEATFLDTAAAVQLALARRENSPTEKRRRLCEASQDVDRAIRLIGSTLAPASTTDSAAEENPSRPTILAGLKNQKDQDDVVANWVRFKRRSDDVQSALADANFAC